MASSCIKNSFSDYDYTPPLNHSKKRPWKHMPMEIFPAPKTKAYIRHPKGVDTLNASNFVFYLRKTFQEKDLGEAKKYQIIVEAREPLEFRTFIKNKARKYTDYDFFPHFDIDEIKLYTLHEDGSGYSVKATTGMDNHRDFNRENFTTTAHYYLLNYRVFLDYLEGIDPNKQDFSKDKLYLKCTYFYKLCNYYHFFSMSKRDVIISNFERGEKILEY